MGSASCQDDPVSAPPYAPPRWTVLVVDDEPAVHQITRLVLADVRFDKRAVELLSADSAAQARSILAQRDDIAVILLDVVMEAPDAGLQLVRHIREGMRNRFVRIVLRTGQPGEAPEREVVSAYDINDYREKTDLTASRLVTTLFSALRSYRDMRTIDAQRQGLERVVGASARVVSRNDQAGFAEAVQAQLRYLLGADTGIACIDPDHAEPPPGLPAPVLEAVEQSRRSGASVWRRDCCVIHLAAPAQPPLLFACTGRRFRELDHQLLRLFAGTAGAAWANLRLSAEMADSQMELVYLLASVAETRSQESTNHVHRVGLLAALLADKLGFPADYCQRLKLAAPLHDIGKVAIPDPILNSPGTHDAEQARVMHRHAEIGARLLASSQRPLMQLAAEIAMAHHENWDGSGYPRGLRGEAIPVAARITAVADVFDALGSRRCYKEPWPEREIRAFLQQQEGRKFDPEVLQQLFAHWDEALAVRERLPD
ncbi:MAG TPA: HD domain-containing phosphohydrolase [Rhodanobacteraceae bacterium]|nr:HD domain-containing phosphohydrolase [Rhodanobacteraceae bacterium]